MSDNVQEYELRSVPYSGYGNGIYTRLELVVSRIRDFSFMVEKSTYFGLCKACACCNNSAPFIPYCPQKESQFNSHIAICPGCQASICFGCINFIECYDCASTKRCRWCGTRVVPLNKVDLTVPFPSYFEDLRNAEQDFYTFNTWKSSILRLNREFYFSGIFWASYFDRKGWRFFVNAQRFFEHKLPNEYNIVLASMLFQVCRSKEFVEFYRHFHEGPESFLFCQSARLVQMNSFAHKMLARMVQDFSVSHLRLRHLQLLVLKRLRAGFALKMSNGLGVNIPPPKNSPDESCFWN
jgi:hypothetical protein